MFTSNIFLIGIIILFLYLTRINKEHFTTRPNYHRERMDMYRCNTIECLARAEEKCCLWCKLQHPNMHDTCELFCSHYAEDTTNNIGFQYQQFGSAIYNFNGFIM